MVEFFWCFAFRERVLETTRDCGEVNRLHAKTSRRAVSQIATTPGWRNFRSAEIA